MLQGHSCMVWVEQSCNFFPRRLHSLQSPLDLFLLREHSDYSLPTPPHPGLPHVGRGHSHPHGVPGWQHCPQPVGQSLLWDQRDPEESGTDHQLHPWATGHLHPQCQPSPEGHPERGTRGAQQADTAWGAQEGQEKLEGASGLLLALWHSVQAEMVSPHATSEM